ncbi:MAG: DUF2341 domain-containing protein, partial [Gammaproteobacteria bacterium]|nr:DUF2341 domain-containing protein [Gammaproteobacteria bacterium]
MTDINNFTYSKQDDGLYKIISENSTTYFGFGISAKTLANNSQKRTTLDFTWSYNKTNTSNGFNIIGNNNANNWITNFSFTNESTKITNMITNNFEFNLHDTKFYYIFSVNVSDNISYRDRNYQVQESSNIHLTNDNLSLNTVATEIKKNNDFYFDYSDIILDGFNVTDIYLTDASFIGAGAGKIIAVGFTKDDGIFSNGETFTIDPKISNKKSYKSVQSNNPKFINNISSDVVFPTKSEMKGKRLHLSPVDKSNHANDVTFKVKTTIFNEISTLQENTFVVWRLDDNGKTISQTVITIDPNSTYTNFKGGFSETVVGGITGQLTKTCTGISSGEACTFDSVNVTKVTVNLTDTSTAYQALLINNTGGSALSDYQINANVTYDSDMQNNFSDLRFRNDTSSENQLYWIESKANGSWANIWINITSIPANSWLNDTIYTYYGNPSVGSASNIDDTMIFGDEYTGITIDTAKWDETDVGSHISQNDKLIFDGGTSTWGQTGIYTDNTFARPFIYQTKWRTSSVTNTRSFGVKDAATSVSYDDFVYLFHADPSAVFKLLEGGSVVKSTDSYTADTDYWLKVEVLSTGAKYYRSTDNENLTLLYTSSYSTESPLKIGATSYQGAQEFDNTFVRKYTANEPIVTVGIAQNITSNVTAGTDTSSDYNITDGEYSHTMSSVQNINNVTPYWDGYGTATVTITALVIDPIVQLTNITSNGRIFGNSTYPPLVYMENVNITIKKPTTTWDNEGTSTLTTNDVNATNFNFTENATQWTIINTTVNTSIELFYNFTKPVNHNPTGSVSNQGFTTLQDASIIVTRADEDNVNQLTCSATLDGTTIDSCTSPIDFGTKSAGIYTIYWNGTDNNGTLSGTGTSFNETATITITQSVITPFGIRDGVYAIRNNSIPSNATILKNKNNSILTNVVTLNWSSITQNTWDEFLGSVNYAYTKGTRIGIRLNFDGIYTDTDNQNLSKTNITTHFPDTKNDPYESDIQWIEFNFTNSSESFADMGTFANEIAENITEQTNNKFPIYTVQAATGLDSIYVVGVSPIQYIIITNLTTFLDDEASTLRSSISKSRVYSDNESDTVLSTLSSYKTNIRNKLRGSIASTHPTETFAVHINNGSGGNDLILFNNQSTIQNRTVANKTGIWLDTTNDVIKNYLVNTTLGFNVSANSFGYIINENVSKLILNNSNAHDVYGQSITYNQTFTYGDNYNSNYVYAGTNTDLKTMLYDPSYRKTRAITDYGWINSSLETNWSNYDVIILADKNWDELNDTINNDDAVHGYVAVLDYTDSDGYVVSKKAEMDWWLSRGYGIFIDGIDFSISADNFSIRLKELVNHGRVNYSESVILNTYTAYDQFSTYGNRVMKESCFARHNDDLENIIYSMEDITLEK